MNLDKSSEVSKTNSKAEDIENKKPENEKVKINDKIRTKEKSKIKEVRQQLKLSKRKQQKFGNLGGKSKVVSLKSSELLPI